MSSNTACSVDGKLCTQAYPIRDYFLALFAIVVCLVCLRMLLYMSYYTWIRISSRRQEQGNSQQPRRLDQRLPLVTAQSSTGPMPSSFNEARVCVIVPGEDRPTFIAIPAPLAPFRDMDSPVNMSIKTLDLPKSWCMACISSYIVGFSCFILFHNQVITGCLYPWIVFSCPILHL